MTNMHTPPAYLRHAACAVWLVLCSASGAVQAASTCNASALNAPGYAQALETVRHLPELTTWSRSHGFPVAFGESMDKQERLDGRCYWSVSVYASRPERLELWQIFYVETAGKRLLVQDPVSGQAISLQKWRSKGDGSGNKSRIA